MTDLPASAELERDRFFDLSVDMLAIVSTRDGCWKQVNPAFTRTLGWDRTLLPGMPVLELVHPDDIAHSQKAIADLGPGTFTARYEQRLRCKDGSYRWVAWNVTLDEESELIYCVGRDTTDRKQAQEALHAARDTFEHLVQNSPFGVYVVDADFRLAQISAGARKVFENVSPLIGRDFAEVLRCIWPDSFAGEAIDHFRHTLATGEPYHEPSTVERRQDTDKVESYDWKIERVTLPDGRYGVVCQFYDLSERQRYEMILRERNRRKDEFLAALAHELRNPLAPIQSGIELLRMSPDESSDNARVLDMMQRQMVHLGRLVDELLDLSRVTSGKITLSRQPTDAVAAIRHTLEDCAPSLQGRQVFADLQAEPLIVDADPVRLVQILTNLLNNAARYTSDNGRIWISAARDGERARISVRDDGVGIAPDQLDLVFDLFMQVHGRKEGLGIGLTLVRRLAELHGGSAQVQSEGSGRGSEFTVFLPLAAHPCRDTSPPESDEPLVLPKRRLLIVDDNPDVAKALSLLLDALGAEVRTANDGPSALAMLEDFNPEIVFLDIGMPGMDGYEVAERIRARHGPGTPRLIAVTGWGQETDRANTRRAGFDGHIVKPATLKDLRAVLDALNAV